MPIVRLLLVAAVLLSTMLAASPARAASHTLAFVIPNPLGSMTTEYARRIVATGPNLLVSSLGDETIFLFDGQTGALLQSFVNPAPLSGNRFGRDFVATGGRLFVGVPEDDAAGSGAGAVMVFDLTTGALLQTLTTPAAAGDSFGWSLAVLGGTLVVGAPGRDVGGDTLAGTVFFLDATTLAMLQTVPNPFPASPNPNAFGHGVAAAGADVVVGTNGGAYLVDGTTGALLQTLNHHPPTPLTDGPSVGVGSLAGQPIVVDDVAHVVHLFDGGTGALVRSFADPFPQPDSARFGSAVADVGGDLLAGAPHAAQKGVSSGVVYRIDAGTGTLLDTYFSLDTRPLKGDGFGGALGALNGSFAVGVNGQDDTGSVHVYDVCGNGSRAVGEQCDDGNTTAGDGCSPTCKLELCAATPAAGCRQAPAAKSRFVVVDRVRDTQDTVTWRWTRGDATAIADFGDPTSTAAYTLCVYDGSGAAQPRLVFAALPGGTCGPSPCWQMPRPNVFQYQDPSGLPSGVQKLKLQAAPAGSAGITLKAKGPRVAPPAMPFQLPVTVQLVNSDTSVCWEATFSGAVFQNDAVKFSAVSDP